MADYDDIRLERHKSGVAEIVFCSPCGHNRMTDSLLRGFSLYCDEVGKDKTARALVISSEGSSFCSGADLTGRLQKGQTGESEAAKSYAMYESFLHVLHLTIPVLASVSGHAVGGGFGLAMLCDIRFVAENAKVGANFSRLGLHPGMGLTYTLPEAVGREKAMDLFFSGRLLTGVRASELGIFSSAHPAADVRTQTLACAESYSKNAPLVLKSIKSALTKKRAQGILLAAREEAVEQALSLNTEDSKEGISALLERREPRFSGC